MAGEPEATAFLWKDTEKGFSFSPQQPLYFPSYDTGWQAAAPVPTNKVLLEHSHTQQSGTDSPPETLWPVSLNYTADLLQTLDLEQNFLKLTVVNCLCVLVSLPVNTDFFCKF